MSERSPLLRVDDLAVVYGRSSIGLNGIDLSIEEGSAVALLGANGAGKTTLIRALSGLLPLHTGSVLRGRVHFDGQDVTSSSAHHLVRSGIGQVPEGRKVFPHLSVEENLKIGAVTKRRPGLSERIEAVYELFPRLRERSSQEAGWMSGGEQQMVAIGRALMSEPRLLLLDELSLGLAPLAVRSIFEALRTVREQTGATMLIVEQNARVALDFADEAYVLERGEIVFGGSADVVAASPRVQEIYLGVGASTAEDDAVAITTRGDRSWV